jgi:NADPH:quinone reductase-like Zn-dependent oxidoreductase
MEAYRIDRFGSVGGIVLRSSEDPPPGLKEVLMRVHASSLNYRIAKLRTHSLAGERQFSHKPASGMMPRSASASA